MLNFTITFDTFFSLFILEIPKISGKLENVTVNEGQEAKFVVKIAGGKPKPSVKWFKEEEEIVTTVETYEVVEFEDTVTLIIKSAKPENSGNYYAQLVNEAGQATTNKAQLTVNSKRCFKMKMFQTNKIIIKILFELKEDQFSLKYRSHLAQLTKRSL